MDAWLVFPVFCRKLAYGVHPVEVAEEVMRTVRRKKQEVFMANPVPKAAVFIRTFFPEFFFAVVATLAKDLIPRTHAGQLTRACNSSSVGSDSSGSTGTALRISAYGQLGLRGWL